MWHASRNFSGPGELPFIVSSVGGVLRRHPCAGFVGNVICDIERDEWLLAAEFVRPGAVVLEYGARWGTTSCALAQLTGNRGDVVAVEPDAAAQSALLSNRDTCRGNFHALVGSVGDFDVELAGGVGYGQRTRAISSDASSTATRVPRLDLDAVQARLSKQINTLLVDCEGCGVSLVGAPTGERLLAQSRLVIVEDDSGPAYKTHLYPALRRAGFHCAMHIHDSFLPSDAPPVSHSVWTKQAPLVPGHIRCERTNERLQRQGLPKSMQLRCSTCHSLLRDAPSRPSE